MQLRLFLVWVCVAVTPVARLAAQVNVLTYHNDRSRTGQNLAETILTPSNVNSTAFGKLFLTTLDGVVDAQPLYVWGLSIPNQGTHNVLIVATENDSLYALDADSGAILWHVSLLEYWRDAVRRPRLLASYTTDRDHIDSGHLPQERYCRRYHLRGSHEQRRVR